MPNYTNDLDAAPRRRKRASRSGGALILTLVGFLVIGGGIFAMIHFLGTGDEADLLAYLPAETDFLVCIEAEELLKDERARHLIDSPSPGGIKRFLRRIEILGIDANDISRVVIGAQRANRGTSGDNTFVSCVIVRTNKPLDWEKLKKALEGCILKSVDGKDYFAAPIGDECFIVPNDSTFVMMRTEAQTVAMLTKDSRQLSISADMQKLIRDLGKGTIWMVMNKSVFADQLGDLESLQQTKPRDGAPIASPDLIDALEATIGFGASLKIEGHEIACNAQMAYADANACARAEESIQKHLTKWRSDLVEKNAIVGDRLRGTPSAAAQFVGDFCKTAAARNDGTRIELSARYPFGRLGSLLEAFSTNVESKPQMVRPIRLPIEGGPKPVGRVE